MNTKVVVTEITIESITTKNLLIEVIGQLDEVNIENVAKIFYDTIDKSGEKVNFLIDFKNLDFINSKGIGYLLDFFRKISEKNGKMVISNPSENVLDILELVGVTKVLKVFLSLEEAKLALRQGI